jgi:hypothetical protein
MNTSFTTNNPMAREMTTPQTLSFMTLPPEIRIQIYKLVFDGIDTLATLEFLARGGHLPITTLVHGYGRACWHMRKVCSGGPPECAGDKSDGAKHASEVMLSLLMTSTQIQNEALPLALPDVELCVNNVRGNKGWIAVSGCPTHSIGVRVSHPFKDTADCSCPSWSTTVPPWKGKLLLKSLNSLTLGLTLFGSSKVTVTIWFSGQRSVKVSLSHAPRSRKEKYTEIKDMDDRAIAKLKANTLRRVESLQFANIELIDGVMDDMCNVGWHASREFDWEDCSSETTWYIASLQICVWQNTDELEALDNLFVISQVRSKTDTI